MLAACSLWFQQQRPTSRTLRGSLQFGKSSITPATSPLVVALYASDGCRIPPNQEAVHGSDAILAQLKAGKDRGLAKGEDCHHQRREQRRSALRHRDVRDHRRGRLPC